MRKNKSKAYAHRIVLQKKLAHKRLQQLACVCDEKRPCLHHSTTEQSISASAFAKATADMKEKTQ